MMPRKKRRMILTLVVIVILIIIATVFFVLYNTTDMLKSNDVLFQKYAIQLLDNIDDIFNEENMAEVDEIVNNNKLISDTKATVKYTENGNNSNPINNLQIRISGQEEKTTGYNYKNFSLVQNDEKLLGAEYIEDDENVGVRLNGIRQYLSTNINDKNESKITDLYKFINTDIKDLLKLSDDEWNSLKEKYIGIIWKNISNANFSKQTGNVIEINGEQYTTNVYSVTITKEQFNNMYIQVLQELKTEEVLLSKLDVINNKINEYHDIVQDEKKSNIKQQVIDKINNIIKEIEDSNIGNDERTISVFESNGVAISLSIDIEEELIGLDIINSEESNFINILEKEKVKDGEQENSFDFKIEKMISENGEIININYDKLEEGQENKNEISLAKKMENAKVNNSITFSRSVGQNTLELNAESVINIVNEFKEKEELIENDNNIIIDKLSQEQKENVAKNVEENLNNQMNAFLQVVTLEDINQMLVNLKFIEKELDNLSSEGNITELEKNRFNSNFELYEGEEITKERVEELINIVKENLGDVRITKYEEQRQEKIPLEYKLVIERGKENTQLAEELISYIEENYSEDFSVKLEYDEITGLISNIYIAVVGN